MERFRLRNKFLKNKSECNRVLCRGGSSAAVTFKMKRFVIIVNGYRQFALETEFT